MHEVAGSAADDRVELVFAGESVAELAAFAQAREIAAVVPAARLLADVAAERALMAQLRARHLRRGLGERCIPLAQERVRGHLRHRRQRADHDAVGCLLDAAQPGDAGE